MSFNSNHEKERRQSNALLPVAGFLLILALGIISYFVADPVRNFVDSRAGANLSGDEVRWVFMGVIFVVLVMLSGLVYAAAMPKKKDQIRDKDIVGERKAMQDARLAKKAKRRKLKGQMKDV